MPLPPLDDSGPPLALMPPPVLFSIEDGNDEVLEIEDAPDPIDDIHLLPPEVIRFPLRERMRFPPHT